MLEQLLDGINYCIDNVGQYETGCFAFHLSAGASVAYLADKALSRFPDYTKNPRAYKVSALLNAAIFAVMVEGLEFCYNQEKFLDLAGWYDVAVTLAGAVLIAFREDFYKLAKKAADKAEPLKLHAKNFASKTLPFLF